MATRQAIIDSMTINENKTAAGEIGAHYRAPVIHGPTQTPIPKRAVESVVGVCGQDAHPYLGIAVIETGAKEPALAGYDVNNVAVFAFPVGAHHLVGIYPWMAGTEGALSLFGDGYLNIGSFHIKAFLVFSRLFSGGGEF